MNDPYQKTIVRETPAGNITLRSFCCPEEIRKYRFDDQFGTHAQYKSIYTKRETLEKHAGKLDANVVLAILKDRYIIGFGVLSCPDPEERWLELGPGVMMEVKAVEVSRRFRSCRIASDLLCLIVAHPKIERMITYMVGYSWTWDLDGSGLNAQQYRNMLIRLFSAYEFIELQTNEPNICLKPENLFMGRMGREITESLRLQFKWLRFGVSP